MSAPRGLSPRRIRKDPLRVRITESFAQAGSTAVQRGCILNNVPELLARTWIRIHRAVELPNLVPPQKIVEQPTSRPRTLETPAKIKRARH
jgi:hypothetical protein